MIGTARWSHRYEFECRMADGSLRWRSVILNLVVNVGLDDMLEKYYRGATYTAAHFVGLTDADPVPAPGDTMASHPGWTENVTYDEAVRQTLVMDPTSGQSISNGTTKAVFNFSGSTTIGGAFVVTDSTKGGTGGILVGVAALNEGNRGIFANDTLSVTITATLAAA